MNQREQFSRQQMVDIYDCFNENSGVARLVVLFSIYREVNHKTIIHFVHNIMTYGEVVGPSTQRQRIFDEVLNILLDCSRKSKCFCPEYWNISPFQDDCLFKKIRKLKNKVSFKETSRRRFFPS